MKLIRCVPLITLLLCELCFATISPLSSSSFSIKTRVYKLTLDGRVDLLLEESYSKSQNKAKIIYHPSGKRAADSREYHYDAYNQHGLLYSKSWNSCEELNLLQFYSSKLYFTSDFNQLMQLEMPNSNPVVGPARLLMLVASRASQLEGPSEQLVYGIPVIKYTLGISFPGDTSGSKIELDVYYDKITHDPHLLDQQFPMFIKWQSLWLHYFQLNLHQGTGARLQADSSHETETGSSDIVVDEFAIPVTSRCLQLLPKYEIYSMFDMQSFKFSFEAETLDSSESHLEHHWVQFDGLLQALRVDSHQHNRPDDLKSCIVNLRKNRRYVITGGQSEKDQRQCLALKNLGKERANLRLSHLLIGQGHLGLVGKAKVRGMDASVYGALSDRLPYWFDQPVLYQLNGTGEAVRRRGVSPYERLGSTATRQRQQDAPKRKDGHQEEQQDLNRYKMLVYFDEDKQERLLALEIYDLLNDESKLLLNVRFRDFVWRLTEAPDGGQISDIFALADACSARPREEHYLDVDMLLRQEDVSPIADSSSKGCWIRDWPARDSALLVGLTDSLDLDGTMVHEIESNIKEDHRLAIDVHFRIAEQSQLLHSLTLIGRANLKPSSNSLGEVAIKHKGSAMLLTDCLSLAASNNKIRISPTYIYYSEQHFVCLIDPTLDGAHERDLDKSPLVELVSKPNGSATGELYKVETHLEDSMSSSMVREKKLKALVDRVLFLNHATGQSAQPIDPALFRVRIERMKINNNNYHMISDNSAVYAGFAFSIKDEFNKLVDLNQLGYSPLGISHCQAACLADYRCNSFSFCMRFPESECILSEIPDAELEKNLTEEKLQGQITVVETEARGNVTLRRDSRCELHRKSYLSQFIRGGTERNALNGHWVIPVSNVEECAQSCFMKTLELFKSMDHESSHLKKDQIGRVCSRFLYLNSLPKESQQEAIREAIGEADIDVGGHMGGFCLIKDDLKARKYDSQLMVLEFDYYDLDFTTLYDRTFGVSLVDTSTDLERATQMRLYHEEPEREHYEILEKADREGRNVQSQIPSITEQLCARKCLMQSAFLWPACRSFDVIRVSKLKARTSYLLCVFNTKLANNTRQEQSNESSSNWSASERWHFEPRWDLVEHALDLEASAGRRWSSELADKYQTHCSWLKGGLIVMGLLILAKLSGFVLGLRLTEKFLLRKGSEPRTTPQSLCATDGGDIALE